MTPPKSRAPKLLLIHLPGADWRLIGPALDAGHLPHLDALITRGAVANLSSTSPLRFPVSAATLATGRFADHHGLFAPVVADAVAGGVRPCHSGDIAVPVLWDMLSSAGLKGASVGWPISYPVCSDRAASVSDVFAVSRGKDFDQWPLDPQSLSTDLPTDVLKELRLHQSEVSAQMLLPFVESPSQIDLETDERMGLIAATLARTSTLHAAATWIAETQEWDCLAVHFDFVEKLTTAFLPYTAPQMPQVTDTDFQIYQNVVSGAYRFFDMLLQRYVELVDEDCTVMLVSGHGYHLGSLRRPPGRAGRAFAAPMYRSLGVLAAAGPRIKEDALVFGPRAVDIVPTALALLDVVPPEGLDGTVIADIFSQPLAPSIACHGEAGQTTEHVLDPALCAHQLKELATLGYIAEISSDPEMAAENIQINTGLAKADALMARLQYSKALASLEAVLAISPDLPQGLLKAAHCHLALKDGAAGIAALDELAASGFRSPTCAYLRGQAALLGGDTQAAAAHYAAAEQSGPITLPLYASLGRGWLVLKDYERAEALFRAGLAIDEDDPLATGGLGKALHGQLRHDEAVDAFKRSLGVLQHQPDVHSFLGHAYYRLGDHDAAAQAYKNALEIRPDYPMALEGMARLGHHIARTAMETVS